MFMLEIQLTNQKRGKREKGVWEVNWIKKLNCLLLSHY